MRQLIVGNWKMNGLRADALVIADALREAASDVACRLVVCPPTTVLAAVAHALQGSRIGVGGQDCHADASGAHTGDISASMLRDAGAGWVILGHSERRGEHAETDQIVRAKVAAAQAAGLHPIVCVGESADDHARGRAGDIVERQLAESLPAGFAATVAYEPIWAIGTGRVPTPPEVVAMHGLIRHAVGAEVRILYGGSVKPDNAARLLACPDVDGALVGGASLVAADFLAIASASLGC